MLYNKTYKRLVESCLICFSDVWRQTSKPCTAMITITCSGCGVKLNIKDEFMGRRFRCPRCKTILTAPNNLEGSDAPTLEQKATPSAPANESTASQQGLASIPRLGKFNTHAVYFLVGADNLVGQWKLDTGWQAKGTQGLVPAKTNAQIIPASGKFLLIEALCEPSDSGKKLKKLTIYKLGPSDAAKRIAGEPTAVLSLITGYGTMTKNQKNAVLSAIKTVFMREIWGGSEKIREFLLGFDSHTSIIEEA